MVCVFKENNALLKSKKKTVECTHTVLSTPLAVFLNLKLALFSSTTQNTIYYLVHYALGRLEIRYGSKNSFPFSMLSKLRLHPKLEKSLKHEAIFKMYTKT